MGNSNDIYKTKYQIYLESEEFDTIRKRIFQRDNNRCKVCKSTEHLITHHLTYQHIFHEQDYELICLCSKCHEIYHTIENYKDYADKKNRTDQESERQQRIKEMEDNWREKREKEEAKWREKNEKAREVEKLIIEKYQDKDYAKNGYLDMCSYRTLSPIIEKEFRENGACLDCAHKQELQIWFTCRRYELLLRCIEAGKTIQAVKRGTKFENAWIDKWYDKEKLLAKLEEEKTLKTIKEDNNNAEA